MKGADYQMPSFQASAAPEAGHTRVSDFSQLIKTRLTFLVLITTGVGFYLGSSDSVDVVRLLNVLLGAALAAAGASALNQWWDATPTP
jgi:heme O synthase-like polyprenyltransferase